MEDNFDEIDFNEFDSNELIDAYNKIESFINYLDKETKNVEKMRDSNE